MLDEALLHHARDPLRRNENDCSRNEWSAMGALKRSIERRANSKMHVIESKCNLSISRRGRMIKDIDAEQRNDFEARAMVRDGSQCKV